MVEFGIEPGASIHPASGPAAERPYVLRHGLGPDGLRTGSTNRDGPLGRVGTLAVHLGAGEPGFSTRRRDDCVIQSETDGAEV